jgi:hypothetical protein
MIGGDKPANAFGNPVPFPMIGGDKPVPPPFKLMPAIQGKAPKGPQGNGIKTMPAPVPTDKAPKTPVIQRL